MLRRYFKQRHLLAELLILAALIGWALFFIIQWPQIPELLPTHFGLSGQPDAWGDKESLLTPLLIGLALYLLLSVVELFPQIWNFPVSVTERNRGRLIEITLELFVGMKFLMVMSFGLISYWTITVQELPVWWLPAFMALLFGWLGLSIWRMIRYARSLGDQDAESAAAKGDGNDGA